MMKTISTRTNARIAGVFYLLVVLTGIFTLAYVPSRLIVTKNPAETYQNIVADAALFRLGIIGGVACYLSFIFLALSLYQLLRQVNETHARLMVLFICFSIPVSFINLQNQLTILSLVQGSTYVKDFPAAQTQSQVMFCLAQYNNGIKMADIFWGLWLLPFGYLVVRSGMLPKIFGILLMFGCAGYLVNFIGEVVIPGYAQTAFANYIGLPGSIGEIGICLWLLIMGAKDKKTATQLHYTNTQSQLV